MNNDELWRAEEIAHYLKLAKKTVQNKVLTNHTFPAPRLLEFTGNKRPAKRWIPKEVIAWATRH
jgi:predicted DNA-binding transcriptional regulator AlpA